MNDVIDVEKRKKWSVKNPSNKKGIISEKKRLKFAKQILLGIGILLSSCIIFSTFTDNSIFQTIGVGLLTMSSSVITFYFKNLK